jgi:thioesterase domain-containing protein
VIQDNLCALYAYLPRPLEIPGVLIKASRQAMHVNAAPDLGWNTFFPAGLDIHTTPGDHFTLMHPPHVQEVARIVLACLDRSLESKPW